MISKKQNFIERFYIILVLVLMYAPLVILMVCSFNDSKSRVIWGGFTFHWYTDLLQDAEVMSAVKTTVLLTVSSAVIATLLGTVACVGLIAWTKRKQAVVTSITQIPMLNADIVTGIAIMLVFVRFGNLGFGSMLAAHITLGIPYVILNVMPKLNQANASTYEAALDLGATPSYAFFKVVLPDIMPGILSGFLLAFSISLDDFVVTYFTKGAGMNTISTMIYQQARRGINPEMYALSTILFLIILLILWLANRAGAPKRKKSKVRRAGV